MGLKITSKHIDDLFEFMLIERGMPAPALVQQLDEHALIHKLHPRVREWYDWLSAEARHVEPQTDTYTPTLDEIGER